MPTPATAQHRIDSLDVLRGFAILGILVMNIQAFAMVTVGYINPTVVGPMTGMDYALWLVVHIGFDGKFLALFSALFGAGVLLMTERTEAAGAEPWPRHLRRMLLLGLIGILHAYLIWYGDILFFYALLGLIAYFFRRFATRELLIAATALYLIPLLLGLVMTAVFHWMPEADYQSLVQDIWQPDAATLAEETAAYRGGWLAQMAHRAPQAMMMQIWLLPSQEGWRILALMLAGMAAYRSGLITADWSIRQYQRTGLIALLIGLPLVIAGVAFNQRTGWEMATSLYLGAEFNALAVPFLSLSWACLVLIVLKKGWLRGLVHRLRAVGRTALTCYLLTSILCTAIFYGHGLGLFGEMDRLQQLSVVVMVWLILLSLAPTWLRYYRMGPVEWLWRWGVYGRRPQIL